MKTVEYDKSVGLTLLCVRAVYRAGRDCVMSGTVGHVVYGLDRRVGWCQ